ncbi:M1 family metallopeptidase [Psychrobacillus glaciei]|nr:M1 family metallopeptidase [Psychrobacillus glaciei]
MDKGTSKGKVTSSLDRTSFFPRSVPAGNYTKYDINLKMSSVGEFEVDANINIKNTSEDAWNELVFYFIPNIFTKATSEKLNYSLDVPARLQFKKVVVEKIPMKYTLNKDKLTVPLKSSIGPGDEVKVEFSYEFTLPEGGLRFTKSNENYHLAQFYPMVATYRNHNWNKEEYRFRGETYHNGFSNFKVSYDIPKGYTFASTSENDVYPGKSMGSFEVNNVKEVFIAILKDPKVIQKQEENVNIRVFGFEDKEDLYKEISEVASDALSYFQKNIGPYPFSQLDIVIDGLGMEYPGIVTANSIYNNKPLEPKLLKKTVIHEIAHQWFYGIISNDPYHDAWLDEGFADFATELYIHSTNNEEVPYSSMYAAIQNLDPLPVNLPLDEYEEGKQSSYIYGKSSVMLWSLFEGRGGLKEAEKFLRIYYQYYQFKEVDSKEFIRFTEHYFRLNDDSVFAEWLLVK